jgi:hypothetical protein
MLITTRWFLVGICAALALCVGRVDAEEPAPNETMVIMKADYGRLGADISVLLGQKDTEIATLKQHAVDLDAYLKACGDKPGCTVPAE